jgi:predicted AAA+ superfamily ATPase
LWDWSEVVDPGSRFENLIASHLLKYCDYLHDVGCGDFGLRYIRNKEKKEIDFLLIKNRKPWIPVEVKLNDDEPSSNWSAFMAYLKCTKAIQVTRKSGVFKIIKQDGYELLIVSADKFLLYLR